MSDGSSVAMWPEFSGGVPGCESTSDVSFADCARAPGTSADSKRMQTPAPITFFTPSISAHSPERQERIANEVACRKTAC
jgi:hypothetical protein